MSKVRKYYVLFILAFATNMLAAQSVGIKTNTTLSHTNQYAQRGFGFASGICYDQKIYKRLEISTGVMYKQFRESDIPYFCFDCVGCPCPERIDIRTDILEIPVNLALDLSIYADSKWKTFLLTGYSYGRVLAEYEVIYEDKEKTLFKEPESWINSTQPQFFNFGFEVRHTFFEKLNFTCGAQFQHTKINDPYWWMDSFNLFIGVGINLEHIGK